MEIAHIYPSDRQDQRAFMIDLEDPEKPLQEITGAEFRIGQVIGVRSFGIEPSDFQALMRSRGQYKADDALRIKSYTAENVKALPPIEQQYSFNHDGFLGVRAAG